ncbi:MAG: hypothetical protein RL329_3019 [Bacteroidota bacterium]
MVPKHYGRNEATVFKKLAKSNDVLFIAYDKTLIDEHTFSKTNKSDFAKAIQTFMNNAKSSHAAITPKQLKNDAAIALIGVLLLSILFLSLVNLQEENGKK